MSLKTEIHRTWSLAWPVFLVHLTTIGISAIDTIMVGRSSTQELAYLGVGRVFYWACVVIAMGLLSGIVVYASRADGARHHRECGAIWRSGIVYALVLSLAGLAFMLLGAQPFLRLLGEPENLVEEGSRYLQVIALGLPVYLATLGTFVFLEGIGKPRPGMVITLSIMPLNIFFNWLFIDGHLGMPAMGATGAALGTVLAQLFGAVMAFAYIHNMSDREKYGIHGPWRRAWRDGKKIRSFGIAPGLASGCEFAGFGSLTLISGHLSTVAVSAFQAVFMLHALSFAMVAGFSIATGIRVGNAIGRGDIPAIHRVVKIALGLTMLAMTPFVLGFLLIPDVLTAPFSRDPLVIAAAAPMIMMIAPFIFFDGVQFLMLHSLRAMGDQLVASLLQMATMFLLMTGAAVGATFGLGLGQTGIVVGLAAALTAAALLLGGRYLVFRRRLEAAPELAG